MARTIAAGSLAERIRHAIAQREREMCEFISALVAIPTENPPGRDYRECAELLAARLRKLGLPAETVRVPSTRSRREANTIPAEPRCCVLSFCGRGRRTLYFHGHYDVVPAQSAR